VSTEDPMAYRRLEGRELAVQIRRYKDARKYGGYSVKEEVQARAVRRACAEQIVALCDHALAGGDADVPQSLRIIKTLSEALVLASEPL